MSPSERERTSKIGKGGGDGEGVGVGVGEAEGEWSCLRSTLEEAVFSGLTTVVLRLNESLSAAKPIPWSKRLRRSVMEPGAAIQTS